MPVIGLDHVNLRVPSPARTLAFFREVLDMEVTPPPGRTSIAENGWVLDAGGAAVIHVGSLESRYEAGETLPAPARSGSGAIHHVALRCEGYEAILGRLAEAGLPYRENVVPQVQLRQIFVTQIDGVLFELNFWDSQTPA